MEVVSRKKWMKIMNMWIDLLLIKKKLYARQFKPTNKSDILQAGQQYKVRINRLLQHYMNENGAITFFMVYKCKLIKYNLEDDKEEYTEVYFHSRNRRLLSIEEFEENYHEALDTINGKLGDYMGESSGWMMDSIKAVNLNIARYNPIRGSSYIPTPQSLIKKMALGNIKNEDQNCFLYSILASLFPNKNHPEKVRSYKKYLDKLNYKDIEMPMAVKDIDKFEKMNDLVINVYGCTEDGTQIWPRRISKRRDKDAINLLMLESGNDYHYVLIKNLNRLLCFDFHHPKEFCPYCCFGFDKRYLKEGQMEGHMEECFTFGGTKVNMPEIGKNTHEYTQYYKQQIAPFCIYADFESVMKKESEKKKLHEIPGYSLCVVSP